MNVDWCIHHRYYVCVCVCVSVRSPIHTICYRETNEVCPSYFISFACSLHSPCSTSRQHANLSLPPRVYTRFIQYVQSSIAMLHAHRYTSNRITLYAYVDSCTLLAYNHGAHDTQMNITDYLLFIFVFAYAIYNACIIACARKMHRTKATDIFKHSRNVRSYRVKSKKLVITSNTVHMRWYGDCREPCVIPRSKTKQQQQQQKPMMR